MAAEDFSTEEISRLMNVFNEFADKHHTIGTPELKIVLQKLGMSRPEAEIHKVTG